MKTTRTEHYIDFESVDNNGDYKFRVFKDCSQIQLQSDIGDTFIDTDIHELTAIRDCINEAIAHHKSQFEKVSETTYP